MSKQVILTGLRANNDLHIGNYFGALLPMVDMANKHAGEYQINLFVPDLHSFTTPIDHRSLYAQTMHNLKIFAAADLDLQNPDLYLYRQSYVPAHSELTWILDCFTGFGQMGRMTQFKDKSTNLQSGSSGGSINGFLENVDGELKVNLEKLDAAAYQQNPPDRVSVGLFNYPVLMAADILLYRGSYVPVGDDQTQHLEFTRDIAERMNKQFADVFPDGLFTVPLPVTKQHEFFGKDQGLRIRDLQNPSKKMSKSDDTGKGVIFLGDDPEVAAKKIMSAETDSRGEIPGKLDYEKQPGVSNLLQIFALLEQKPLDTVIATWKGNTSYGELKQAVAEKVKAFLTDFQARFNQVDEQALHSKLESSEYAMNEVANTTLARVQRAVGLRPKKSREARLAGSTPKPQAIGTDHFAKIDIRIGTVTAAEKVSGSDKLIKLQVNLGDQKRQILTGMQAFYRPEDFIGKQVPILVNLASRTMQGEESQGMLLALEGENGPVFLTPEKPLRNGSPLT